MKKILSIFVALVLVFALCAMPASAETNAKEWKKGTGPAKINFSDEGTKISIDEGVNLYYYQKPVNVRDFTVKVKFNAPEGSSPYFAMTIGGNGKFTGTTSQNFIVMWARGDHLCIDPQILHNGKADIKPASRNLYCDYTKDELLFHFKKVNDTTYSIEVEEQGFYYEYCIPENFNWVEDMNGEGCLGFGGSTGAAVIEEHGFGSVNVVVKEINGVKMNGKDEPVSSNTSTGGTTGGTTGGSDSTVDPDTGINTGIIGGDTTTDTTDTTTEEKDNTLLIVIIICGAVLLLAVVAMVIVIVLKKKAPAPVEAAEETVEEPTEE